MDYGTRFKERREYKELTQKQVAAKIGSTQQQIYKYENNLQEMTGSRIRELCILYNVSADYILGLQKGLDWPRIEI